jgi:hypothetical protein
MNRENAQSRDLKISAHSDSLAEQYLRTNLRLLKQNGGICVQIEDAKLGATNAIIAGRDRMRLSDF